MVANFWEGLKQSQTSANISTDMDPRINLRPNWTAKKYFRDYIKLNMIIYDHFEPMRQFHDQIGPTFKIFTTNSNMVRISRPNRPWSQIICDQSDIAHFFATNPNLHGNFFATNLNQPMKFATKNVFKNYLRPNMKST